MEFRIADTFQDSLAKLTGDEQKAAKTAAFDLQLNPANPGLRFHKLNRAKDKNFWSVRAGRDIRLIVHRSASSLLLCYVGHHDPAYQWAERRKLESHPTTGAAQLVEIRETVREIEVPQYRETIEPSESIVSKSALFEDISEAALLSYGVPVEWLEDARRATEDTLFDLADHLPSEAADALLELATGGTPQMPLQVAKAANPFTHPDAQRRFRLVATEQELQLALDYPWEKWAVFLHPAQRAVAKRRYKGPARVAGSAGTGKTVVALHRAAHLARAHPNASVLLTTFSEPLARALGIKLDRLVGNDTAVRARIEVRSINPVGIQLYEASLGTPMVPDAEAMRGLLRAASEAGESHKFADHFLETEWRDVVDAWQLGSWEDYRDVARLGRKRRLGEKQRSVLWAIFKRVRKNLTEKGWVTVPSVFAEVTRQIRDGRIVPFDFVVVDEAQDIGVPQLRFLAAIAGERPNGLFFAGDLGQRIFQTPFSWRSLGVDVRGRSQTLRINYRTSHQIRRQADRLLPDELSDVDGNKEVRRGTISAFSGPEPEVCVLPTVEEEHVAVGAWITERHAEGMLPEEIGVFVRSDAELGRAANAVEAAGLRAFQLDEVADVENGAVAICTMHLAKGLEFRGVAVIACDDQVVPLQARIESIADAADLEDAYNTERHLLYVACTRARDRLLVTGVEPASEFIDDLGMATT